MNIVVSIKQVPASETKVKIAADGLDIDRTGISYVVNPYDEFGVEEALRIKERLGSGSVTVVTVGPEKAQEALRTCLAVGADKAVHIKDPAFEGGDAYATAVALAAALKRLQFDVLFFGKQAIDDDNGAVGIHVAELLRIPHVAVVNKLEIDEREKRAVAYRQIEGALEVIETSLPAVFTCQKGLNEPRYASLPGIMKAKSKPMTVLSLADLGLKPEEVGQSGSKLHLRRISPPPPRTEGKILQGEVSQAVTELVRLLREEAKVL
jgi:electron transfer flavoprotein beta subunit